MSLPNHIRKKFSAVDPNSTVECMWYGPWNMLLTSVFRSEDDYEVVPQMHTAVFHNDAIDFITSYMVIKAKHPVFFVEIKPAFALKDQWVRGKADDQIRERYDRNTHKFIVPKLYAMSAFGSKFCVYEYDKRTNDVTPQELPRKRHFCNDYAPIERWEFELLEEDGAKKFFEIVDKVIAMCGRVVTE